MKSKDDRKSIERARAGLGRLVLVCVGVALGSLVMACAGGNETPPGGEGGAGGDGGAGASGGSGGAGGAGGDGGAGGAVVYPVAPEGVAEFSPLGQLPEGIVIDGTTAYVSFSVDPKVVKVDLETGAVSDWGPIPAPIGIGFPQGLGLDAQKNVYVVVKSEDPAKFKPGVYRFPPGGGEPTWVSGTDIVGYPRTIGFTTFGSSFFTSPVTGHLGEIITNGTLQMYGPADELTGDEMSACAFGELTPMGITSVLVSGNSTIESTFYWTNADRAAIYKGAFVPAGGGMVELKADPNPVAGPDCALLGGAEGLIEDPADGSMLVAARRANKIVRVKSTGETQVLSEGAGYYEPSALAIGETSKGRHLYITNSAHTTYNKGGVPGLVRIPLPSAP
ncbi:hypothetical protein [Polyangium spumosum]|uniref:hypothetical protein n=1 Tax=Polyangium spumosum TaxID=889282 RepID=UPI001981A004|nr:hypothetical protein [Polyangium spumosum]